MSEIRGQMLALALQGSQHLPHNLLVERAAAFTSFVEGDVQPTQPAESSFANPAPEALKHTASGQPFLKKLLTVFNEESGIATAEDDSKWLRLGDTELTNTEELLPSREEVNARAYANGRTDALDELIALAEGRFFEDGKVSVSDVLSAIEQVRSRS